MRYRKKPVVIEAMQYLREENIGEIIDFVGEDILIYHPEKNEWFIVTLEGLMLMSKGDFIIKGIQGEFYPCKLDIFEQTYEKVDD